MTNRKAHLVRTGVIVWLLLLATPLGQTPVSAREKNKTKDQTAGVEELAPLTVKVTPRYAIVGAPLQALVRIAPNADNRLLRIMVDSLGYYRSSDFELPGADAAVTHQLPLKALPAGDYALLVVVYGTHGERARSEQQFKLFAASDFDQVPMPRTHR